MDFWVIQDGETRGPMPEYEIRRRITSGEFGGDTPAWHEGIDGWRPLEDIPQFEREFWTPLNLDDDDPEDDLFAPRGGVDSDDDPRLPPPLPPEPAFVRRFWARWLDLYLFAGCWWLALWLARQDIGAALMNPWVILPQYVPWFVLEAWMIRRFGTTPGKWLLGLRVENDDGSRLSLADATRRSARVLMLGIGLGWGWLALICQGLSLFTAKRIGRPLWDHAGGHQVRPVPPRGGRIVAFIVVFFVALQLQMIVIAPYVLKSAAETFPALKEHIERNPPWHLPRRH